jgi:hypothetical protein
VQLSAYVKRSTIQYQSIPKSVQQSSIKQSGGIIDFDRDFAGGSARWIGRFQLAGGKLTTTVGLITNSLDDRRGYENFIGTTLGSREHCVAWKKIASPVSTNTRRPSGKASAGPSVAGCATVTSTSMLTTAT